ncbi:hypothetical protein DPMN_000665 [Dreissena polymorpha]|uniref:C2H2-type domain-containing protein n=1 Tax=Dreissena polymorpha TaxID=45954 RepID=A0A9D4MGA2_DREPO|nr:hypothetical protein DPMN_000665 [Dreissena polymorpha]
MSFQGGVGIKKHGGAHEAKDKSADEKTFSLTSQYLVCGHLSDSETSTSERLVSQDGGQADEGSMCENLPFLPELGTDCLDSYETAVVENNAEWLKARCKNLSQMEFDIGPQVASDEHIEFSVIPLDGKEGINADSLITSKTTSVHNPSQSSHIITCTQGAQYATPYLSLSGTNVKSESWQPEPCSSSNLLQSIILNDGNNQRTVLINDNNEIDLGTFDINLLKSNNNLTYKDGVLTILPVDSSEIEATCNVQSQIVNNTYSSSDDLNKEPLTQNLHEQESIPNMGTIILNANNVNNGHTNQESLALTTISIAADKTTDSTKIFVDTSQGRQLYELNISDLIKLQHSASEVKPVLNGAPTQSYILLGNPSKTSNGTTATIVQQNDTHIQLEVQGKDKNKPQMMYMCSAEGCGKVFKNMSKLTVHVMTHSGERPFRCTEPGCDWAFTKLYKLKRHQESHKGSKEFQCEKCNKKFTTIYNLKTHLLTHTRPCTEQCPFDGCDLKFQTRRELDKHLKTHEGIEKTYKCPYEGCNKLFLSPHCLGSHPRVHQIELNDLVCQFEGCGRKFDKMCRLKQHQRSHTGEKPFTCNYPGCDWAFSTASKLTRHMTKHTNSRKWICNVCGKAFLRSEHLKGHMISHTGIKPFICPVEGCNQKFVSKSSVYVHIKKHKNKGQRVSDNNSIVYHCPMDQCQEQYDCKTKLRSHMLKHFPETMTPEDAFGINITPLSQNGIGPKRTVIQPAAVKVKTSHDGSITIDPLEYMASTVNQDDGTVTNTHYTEASSVSTASEKREHTTPAKRRILGKKDSGEPEPMSSARTDYAGNKLLSEKAKKRQKLLREKAGNSSEEGTELSTSLTDETSTPTDTLETDTLRSHGITFRDPETGVLYVQMQLLQDDPPHPDLYSDEHMMTSQLDMTSVSQDNGNQAEFVGSTINLQDLVGLHQTTHSIAEKDLYGEVPILNA